MRWKRKLKNNPPQPPNIGTKRQRKVFAWWPQEAEDEYVYWLEKIEIEEEYGRIGTSIFKYILFKKFTKEMWICKRIIGKYDSVIEKWFRV